MEQFEYKRVFYEHGCQISDLNNEGKNGWELCEIERQCGARTYAIFKKKKVNNDKIDLLLDSIDHAYLNTNGTYNDLALEVVDKVKYLKSIRCKQ